jgi:hypothetical protein
MTVSDLRFLDPADSLTRQAWDDVVKVSPHGTIFHTTAWMDVIRKGLGLEPRFAYLRGPHGSIRALVPLFCAGGWVRPVRWLNLPQGCASDPLAFEEVEEDRLLEQLASTAIAHGVKAVVLRTPKGLELVPPSGWEVRREQALLRHVIDLRGASDLRTLPRIQHRQRKTFASSMRKLERREMAVRLVQRSEARAFARVVHTVLLRKHGHLGMPASFIEALLDFLPGAVRLALAGSSKGPASAFTITVWNRDCSSSLYGAGLPTKEGTEAYRVGVGAEIEAAIRANLSRFDLGETPLDDEGLVSFKERLGGERVDGSYVIIAGKGVRSGLRDVTSRGFATMQHFFRYVPVGVSLKIAGPVHRMLQ